MTFFCSSGYTGLHCETGRCGRFPVAFQRRSLISEETQGGRRLDRRGFLGAAAGVAAAGASATAWGAAELQIRGEQVERRVRRDDGVDPKARRGVIHFPFLPAGLEYEGAVPRFITLMK